MRRRQRPVPHSQFLLSHSWNAAADQLASREPFGRVERGCGKRCVEIGRDPDLAFEESRLAYVTATDNRNKPGHGPAGPDDDDLGAAHYFIDEAGQIRFRFVNVDVVQDVGSFYLN